MTYDEMVAKIADTTGLKKDAVKSVLFAVPDILIGLAEDEMVRTPLGTFRMVKRAAKTVKPPKGKKVMTVPASMTVKLKAAARLKKSA
jgi:nucleoid DNA-binding protein